MRHFRLTLMGAFYSLVMVAGGCVTTGPGGKTSFLVIGSGQEVEMGRGMSVEVAKQNKVSADTAWQRYITELGQKIVRVSDRADIEYHFAVIESDEINAFALPGGYVYFYTGLLSRMDNEAQLVAVMSHEISHVVARHGMKRLQTALIAQLGYSVVFGDNPSQVTQAGVGLGMGLIFSGYSRSAEREADRYGIQYMVQAGYHPTGATQMFEVLAAAGEGQRSFYEKLAASHPETLERVSLSKKQISEMGTLPAGLRFEKEGYQRMKARLPKPSPKN